MNAKLPFLKDPPVQPNNFDTNNVLNLDYSLLPPIKKTENEEPVKEDK